MDKDEEMRVTRATDSVFQKQAMGAEYPEDLDIQDDFDYDPFLGWASEEDPGMHDVDVTCHHCGAGDITGSQLAAQQWATNHAEAHKRGIGEEDEEWDRPHHGPI